MVYHVIVHDDLVMVYSKYPNGPMVIEIFDYKPRPTNEILNHKYNNRRLSR
jgi:hypothetical protein